jgi:methylmalonyl-CoA mutase
LSSAEDATTAFKASGASLVVICSSDDVYAEMAVDTARQLKEAGALRVLLAGKPADQEALSAAGVDDFIYLGANVLKIVGELMGCLGVLS